jgi:hypothetical protein
MLTSVNADFLLSSTVKVKPAFLKVLGPAVIEAP